MDLRQLEIFVCVADTGSFSRTAEKLFITQPTVSAHIRQLETELGVELFLRNTRSLHISEAGRCLYPYALTMLDLRTRAQRELADLAEGRKIIRIGASTIPSAYILPELIANYQAEHLDLYFEIVKSDSQTVVSKVSRGEIDLGLVGTKIECEKCIYLPFCSDDLVVATPRDAYYETLYQNGAGLVRLAQEPILLRERTSGTRRETERILREVGVGMESLKVAAVFNDDESIRNSIIRGMGISIISYLAVEDLAAEKKLLIFPIREANAKRQMYIIRRSDMPVSNDVEQFLKTIRENMPSC